MVISPELKTMAFGGVATGIIKAQLAAIAVGMISNRGLIPNPTATAAKIGPKAETVAMLLDSSVTKITVVQTIIIKTTRGSPFKSLTVQPMNSATPVVLIA